MTFRLYPEEAGWWSFQDYAAVLSVMERLKPKRVLEFGPGSSTLALIEGGAESIDACEDSEDWFGVYTERLEQRFPEIVRMHLYPWAVPLTIPAVDGQRFELALIDGPKQTPLRPIAIEYCVQRCDAVLFPTEDYQNVHASALRPFAFAIAEKYGRNVEIMDTGPLSGGFALLT